MAGLWDLIFTTRHTRESHSERLFDSVLPRPPASYKTFVPVEELLGDFASTHFTTRPTSFVAGKDSLFALGDQVSFALRNLWKR